jgi:general secretion pathway protein D
MPISDRFQNVTSRARLLAVAPLTCLLLSQPLAAQKTSALAQAELQRRASNAQEAQELLKKGDESYKAGKWADAVKAYSGARELLPEAPATAAMRDAATERLIQASVEQARNQKRLGDVEGANETIGKVLVDGVAPDSGPALEMQEQINDPIRTNPAATLEHGKDVEEVRLLLYKADGFKNLGEYDKASMVFEDVLQVDPTNKAARRGMEEVVQLKADYYRAARDEARAVMLGEVDESWQLRVRPKEDVTSLHEAGRHQFGEGDMLLSSKMERIILPVISFDGVKIQEAFDFLRAQSIDRDTIETDPTRKGINFVINLGDSEAAKAVLEVPITLELRNVPLSQVVKYIADVTRTIVVPQEFAVEIRPAGAGSGDMITRTYSVPPDFLSQAGNAAGGAGELDPFEEKQASEGLLAARISATDALKNFGVGFPEGASANYNATNSKLRVTNTAQNLAMVEPCKSA